MREQVATVKKFLPWQTPQIQTEGINGGLVHAEGKMPSYKHRKDTAMSRTVVPRKTLVSR